MKLQKELFDKPTQKFSQAINERKSKGQEVLSFGLGEPDFKTPQYIIDEMNLAIQNGYTHYCDSQGLFELRELIALQATKDYKLKYNAQEVVILPGIKSAVYSALTAILLPGDKVGLVVPCYVAYPAMIKMAEPDAEIVEINMNRDFSFDIDEICKSIKSGIKCLIINSPNNPTGAMLSREEMDIIVECCVQNNVYLLSDEVYDKITFSENHHISFGEYKQIKNLLILANGYSKSHAMTGWRLGYAIAPKEICQRIARIQFNTNTNTCTFIQKAACSIYYHNQNHINEYANIMKERVLYFNEKINNLPLLKGIPPRGGLFYFVDISETMLSSNDFCAKLVLETGIATTPGIAFGSQWDNYVRFSLAVPMDKIKIALELMSVFMQKMKEEMNNG